MKATSMHGGHINRWLLASVGLLAAGVIVGMCGLAAACGGAQMTSTASATSTTQAVTATQAVAKTTTTEATRATPQSRTEIAKWKTDAITFADAFYGVWPNADAESAVINTRFAEDITMYDPCDGDFHLQGRNTIDAAQHNFLTYFQDATAHRQGVYLSAGGAAYDLAIEHMWPPWTPEPADHPPVNSLEMFRFKDGQATKWEVSFSRATLEMVSFGVFIPGKGGAEQLQTIAGRYLAAWSSGDKDRIAALYHKDATFSDTVLGLQAQGPAAISELSQKRFGSAGKVTFEIMDLYAQTNGYVPPTKQQPEQGAIIAVGIHYRCTLVVSGKPGTVESLTTFDLGTRREKSFDIDPDGLITREEVFYDADSLLASGLVL
jgi:hypothetical protein